MDKHIIQTLVDTYKADGVNVSHLLSNPLFESLTLSEKIHLLKSNAQQLSEASATAYKPDIKKALFTSGHAAAVAGMMATGGAMGALNSSIDPNISWSELNKVIPYGVIGKIAAGAGAATLAAAAINEYYKRKEAEKIQENLKALASNQTDEEAIRFLLNKSRPIDKSVSIDRLHKAMISKGNIGYMPAPTLSAKDQAINAIKAMKEPTK